MVDSPFIKRLRQRARDVGGRAIEDLLESRGSRLSQLLERAQDGKRTVDEGSARVLGALGLATQDDLQRVAHKVGRLRKRLLALLDAMDDHPGTRA